MPRKRGIPDGARWTPVPDLFFSRFLPSLADPLAIKAFLHILWRIHRRPRGAPAAVRQSDLLADPVLRRSARSLGLADDDVQGALTRAIEELVDIGLLLAADVPAEEAWQRWLFVNCRQGRTQYDRWREGGLALPSATPAAEGVEGRPNIFALYEDNIGLLTPMMADELRDAVATYPETWIEDAIRLAVTNNARRWSYVRRVLERWGRDGRGGGEDETHRRSGQGSRRRSSEDPYSKYVRR